MDQSIRKYIEQLSFFFVFYGVTLFASNDQECFLYGNKCYTEKKYDEALMSYQSVQSKGRAVFYNMGNCYYYKEDYVNALIYWQRAERGATYQEYMVIEKNKEEVFKKLGKPVGNGMVSFYKKHILSLISSKSARFLQVFFLFLWYISIFLFFYAKRRFRKLITPILVIIFFYGLMIKQHIVSVDKGIVTTKGAPIFAGPNKNFHSIGSLAYADNVEIKEKKEGWYKVRYTDTVGWVEGESIRII